MTAPPPSSRAADIRAAYDLVKDLFAPDPRRYWAELVVTGSAAWAALLTASASGYAAVVAVAWCLAVPLWYRAAAMVHELTHQRRDEIPGFHLAWNLVVGVAWLLPSVMYEGVHGAHHRKTTYGTAADPEYLRLAGRRGAVLWYLAQSFLFGPIALIRFLVGAPLSWAVPPLRRLIIRSASSYVINIGFVRRMSRAERRRLVRWEVVILLAWWPPVALTLAGVLPWRWLAVWYATYSVVLLVNRVRMLAAHRFESEGVPTDHLGQFADSIDTPAGWWAELWAPLGMRYHALHHLFPTLPFHNLRAAYRRLTAVLPADSFYHEARGRGLLWAIARLLSGPRSVEGNSHYAPAPAQTGHDSSTMGPA
jgi:fatty acid desaturase